jgi:hypothetical protein
LEHSLVQTSCELFAAMVSHSVAHDWLWVCVQVVVSVAVQFALHVLNVFCAQTCSTEVVAHVLVQSWVGLNSQEDDAERKMLPHLSSALACAVLGNSEDPNSNTDADTMDLIRKLMARLPLNEKWPRYSLRGEHLQLPYHPPAKLAVRHCRGERLRVRSREVMSTNTD